MLDPYKKPWPYQRVNTAHPLAHKLSNAWAMNEKCGFNIYDYGTNKAHGIWDIVGAYTPVWLKDGIVLAGTFSIGRRISVGAFSVPGDFTLVTRFKTTILENNIIFCNYTGANCLFFNIDNDGDLQLYTGTWLLGNNTYTVTDNIYHTVVAVRRGSTGYIYVDGKLDKSGAIGTGSVSSPGYIGWYQDPQYFFGTIQYFYRYDRALTINEIAQLHTNPYQMFEPVFNEVLFGYVAPVAGGLSIPIAYHHYRQLYGN